MKKIELFVLILLCTLNIGTFAQTDTIEIKLGSSHNATLQEDGTQLYSVNVSSDTVLIAYTESDIDTIITIYDASGEEIASDDDSGTDDNARVSVSVTAGTYIIEVSGYEDESGPYTLYVTTESQQLAKQDKNTDWSLILLIIGSGVVFVGIFVLAIKMFGIAKVLSMSLKFFLGIIGVIIGMLALFGGGQKCKYCGKNFVRGAQKRCRSPRNPGDWCS